VSAYTDAVAAGLRDMKGVSSGECPGCECCAERHDMTPEEHTEAWRAGKVENAGESFSWCCCGVCGTTLGGNRYTWHWINGGDDHGGGGEIVHEDDMCEDCVFYLAYGTEPEQWRARA
jgi:hypothetical protein